MSSLDGGTKSSLSPARKTVVPPLNLQGKYNVITVVSR